MKKRLIALVLCSVMLMLSACQTSTPEPSSNPSTPADPGTVQTENGGGAETKVDPIRFSWGTSGSSTGGYIVAAGIANVVNQHSDILTIDVEASAGQGENLRNLADGIISVGQGNNDGTYYYYTSTGAYADGAGDTNIRDLFPLPRYVHHVVVAENSGIFSMDDLKGKRVAVGTAGSGYYTWSETILTAAGMTFDDINPVYIQPTEAVTAMSDGQIDALMFANFMPWGSLTDLCSNTPVRFINVDEKIIDNMHDINPAYKAYTIPANTYPGQTEEITTSSQTAMVWTFYDSLSEEHAYEFVKTVWESFDDWVGVHDSCKYMSIDDAVADMVVPLHAGAYRYYKEIGLDIPDDLIPPEAS